MGVGTFVEWVCPTCGCMWVYRNTADGLASMAIVQAEHRHCVAAAS